jgi:hypothetical protein
MFGVDRHATEMEQFDTQDTPPICSQSIVGLSNPDKKTYEKIEGDLDACGTSESFCSRGLQTTLSICINTIHGILGF